MGLIRNVQMQVQLTGYDFRQRANQTLYVNKIEENTKVSNDSFSQSNVYTQKDIFGKTIDLTALINRPDEYLQGKLSDVQDVDYYKFDISEYRGLSFSSDNYNLDITITLDHVPKDCEYELILYDEKGRQVGIGKDNGNGGLSVTVPNWNLDNKGYAVKVQTKNGSSVNPEEYYHLSFQTSPADKNHGAYREMAEIQKYEGIVRQQLRDGKTDTEEMRAIKEIRKKYEAYYEEQSEKLHKEQAEEYLQGKEIPDKTQIKEILHKLAMGESLTEQEAALANIFSNAKEMDSAKAGAKLNTSLKAKITSELEKEGIDISQYSFSIDIGANGKVAIVGIEEEEIKNKVEQVYSKYAKELTEIYFSMNSKIQKLTDRERHLLETAADVEKFLYKATSGTVSLKDLTLENGIIKGLPVPLSQLINNPRGNVTYQDYQEDIKNLLQYERLEQTQILSGWNVKFAMAYGGIGRSP